MFIRRACTGKVDARCISGLLLQQLVRHADDKLDTVTASLLPVAFYARFDDDAAVHALWQDIWTELGASDSSVLALHGDAVVAPLVSALAADNWGQRAAAARAIAAAAASSGTALQPFARRLMASLLEQLPGRVWVGKEALVATVGALALHCGSALTGEGGVVVDALLATAQQRHAVLSPAAADALVDALKGFEGTDHVLPVLALMKREVPAGAPCLMCS
jgi:HPt (histidine-containing phosphotransfer) domain-containing protein